MSLEEYIKLEEKLKIRKKFLKFLNYTKLAKVGRMCRKHGVPPYLQHSSKECKDVTKDILGIVKFKSILKRKKWPR